MSSLRQNFTEIIAQSVETKRGPQAAVEAASRGRGTKGEVAPGGQAQAVAAPPGGALPGPQAPGSGPGLQLPPQDRSQGLGGLAWSSGPLCAGAFPAARAPHPPLGVVVMVEIPQSEPLYLQPCLQDPG